MNAPRPDYPEDDDEWEYDSDDEESTMSGPHNGYRDPVSPVDMGYGPISTLPVRPDGEVLSYGHSKPVSQS